MVISTTSGNSSWQTRLAALPSLPIAHLPTPLERLQRLRAALGGDAAGVPRLWVKRDDAIGLAVGGNKVRKLAYLLADAQARGARKVVSFGGLQSNFLRARWHQAAHGWAWKRTAFTSSGVRSG